MNQIFYPIMQHLTYLEYIENSSTKLLELLNSSDVEQIWREGQNRNRLLNLIGNIQLKVEEKIRYLAEFKIDRETLEIVKSWNEEFQLMIRRIAEKDALIIEHLERVKNETTQEIAQLHRLTEQFKGYNLSNVKK